MNTENSSTTEDFLTYGEAAMRLKCSRKTIQRLVNAGTLTVHKRPGTNARLIPAAEIAALEAPKPIGDDQQ